MPPLKLAVARRPHAVVVLAIVVTTAAARAADWTASYSDDSHYTVQYSSMPDFDQRRPALPNGGEMYCVPTAAINAMAFLANHGQPQLAPGPANWQSQSQYNAATSAIASMGALMGTHPVDGTDGGSGLFGMAQWLAAGGIGGALPPWYAVVHMCADGDGYVPRFSQLSMHALQQQVVVPVVGWYVYVNQPPFWEGYIRDGGHALTLTRVSANGSDQHIRWRDPADDGLNATQSQFVSQEYAVQPETIGMAVFNGQVNVTLDRIVGYGPARLDAFFAIQAPFCVTTSLDQHTLSIFNPAPLLTGPPNLQLDFPSPNEHSILDLEIHPEGLHCYVLTAGDARTPTKVRRITSLTGAAVEVLSVADGRRIAFDRFRRLYVLDGDTIRRYALDQGAAVQQVAMRATTPPDAMAIDDRSPTSAAVTICALSLARREIQYIAGNGNPPPPKALPAHLQLGGVASLTVSHLDGSLWVTSMQSDELYRLVANAEGVLVATTVGRDLLSAPGDICVADNGHVLVSSDRVIVEFEPLADGTWRRVLSSPFAGRPAARALRVMRSHTNWDASVHTGPAWRNVLPTRFSPGIPDCPGARGDANCDGVVDFFDIDAFLAALFEPSSYAAVCGGMICTVDADCSGVVDFFDIDPFLACLFGLCPPCP